VVTVRSAQFPKASAKAIQDPHLQRLLGRIMRQLRDARAMAVDDISEQEWELLRQRARDIKAEAINHLDYYLDLLDRSVRRNGGYVHFVRTAAEANETVLTIAKRQGVKHVVKAKSMVTEEIGLTAFLEREGIETVETDLGEFIVQLAQEPSSHIVVPALHKSRQDVSELFQRKLQTQPTTDVDELCGITREKLRERFVEAEMGITGANFLVAETGTVVLVTNEGNGRMTTSLPRVHVVVAGLEKVVPALEDVGVFLKLLARSATGQRMTSYTTFASGPRGPSDEDGTEEFHLVIVDNGRTKLLRDEELREALYCIRCGACSNVCPVYGKVGGHAYGWVYSGPIGAVLAPVLTSQKQAKHLPYASTLCGACRDVCPVKIDLPKLLLRLRQHAAEGGPQGRRINTWMERLLVRRWSGAVRTRQAMERSLGLARLLQKPLLRSVPVPLRGSWTKDRDFPVVASESFHHLWKARLGRTES